MKHTILLILISFSLTLHSFAQCRGSATSVLPIKVVENLLPSDTSVAYNVDKEFKFFRMADKAGDTIITHSIHFYKLLGDTLIHYPLIMRTKEEYITGFYHWEGDSYLCIGLRKANGESFSSNIILNGRRYEIDYAKSR